MVSTGKSQKIEVKTFSAEETRELGRKLSRLLTGGEVIFLCGELGSGKTTFAQGVAQGLKVKEPLRSASFVLLWETESGRIPLYHLDLYRLSPEEVGDLGLEEYFFGSGVVLVEWAEKLKNYDGSNLKLDFLLGEEVNERLIKVSWQGKRWEGIVEKWLKGK